MGAQSENAVGTNNPSNRNPVSGTTNFTSVRPLGELLPGARAPVVPGYGYAPRRDQTLGDIQEQNRIGNANATNQNVGQSNGSAGSVSNPQRRPVVFNPITRRYVPMAPKTYTSTYGVPPPGEFVPISKSYQIVGKPTPTKQLPGQFGDYSPYDGPPSKFGVNSGNQYTGGFRPDPTNGAGYGFGPGSGIKAYADGGDIPPGETGLIGDATGDPRNFEFVTAGPGGVRVTPLNRRGGFHRAQRLAEQLFGAGRPPPEMRGGYPRGVRT
jgi:hypothetical protein